MITTTLIWSSDISTAPRGETVQRRKIVTVNGELVERFTPEFIPHPIIAMTKAGEVVKTHWLPPRLSGSGAPLDGGRWSGLATGSDPVLWAAWPNAAELQDAAKMEVSNA